MSVSFQSPSKKLSLRKKTILKKWIDSIIKKEKKESGKIIFIFCSDKELLAINKEFLDHDTFTDIITFDYSAGKTISGEIYISVERVGENAGKFKNDFESESHRVMIHGILHLCGYKDKSAAQKKEMRKKEAWALGLLKI